MRPLSMLDMRRARLRRLRTVKHPFWRNAAREPETAELRASLIAAMNSAWTRLAQDYAENPDRVWVVQ